ncbi:unnamed protein product [Blepharisma stoltei]|uniref:Uncharacterized protein n=1 Tax=Blepharisma stoltei TaxID=1481888 RepID=A0AAU9IZW1_9CILI|nr:unnamed protein product [Blepharisma stoltei]
MSKEVKADFLAIQGLLKSKSKPVIEHTTLSRDRYNGCRSTSTGISSSNQDLFFQAKLERDSFNKSATLSFREQNLKRKPVKLEKMQNSQNNHSSPSPDFTAHSFLLQPKTVDPGDLYKINMRKSSIDQLIDLNPADEIIAKEEAKSEFLKNCQKFDKIKKLLSNQDLRYFEDFIAGLEASGKIFCECEWLNGKGRVEAVNTVSHLVALVLKAVSDLIEKKNKDKTMIETLKSENEVLASENNRMKDLQNKLEYTSSKLQKLESSRHEFSNSIGQTQRLAEIEKEKLVEKNSILEKYIGELKDVTKIDSLNSELEKYKENYQKMIKEYQAFKRDKESKLYRMQLEIGELRSSLQKNSSSIETYDTQKKVLEERAYVVELKNRSLMEKLSEYRERVAMLYEDCLRFVVYRDLYTKLEEQFNTMRLKYNQLELNIIAGNVTLATDGVIWVSLEDPLFDPVRGFLAKGVDPKVFEPPAPRKDKRTNTEVPVYAHTRHARTVTYSETQLDPSFVNLSKLKLQKPGYASLFEIGDKAASFELPFTNWLEITMRGIYDSKYNEHIFCSFESGRTPSKFPEFVYCWIGRFTIDPGARQVRELEWWKRESSDKLRLELLLALKHEKAKKVWEIHTFVEFLNEDLMLDELAFFLHCRFLLFKGPQLMITSGRFSALHFVALDHVFEIIDRVMEKISPKDRSELKSQLQSKARNKNGSLTLDAGLALRIMLEYYIREKKCKYLVIKGLFNLAPKKPDGGLAFQTFRIICLNLDPEASESLIVKMYRDLWAFGNGQINHDNFFVYANENGFFFHSLRLKGNEDPLPLTPYNEIDEKASDYAKRMRETFNTYAHLKQPTALIREALRSLGVIDLLDNFVKLEELVKNKYQEPLENYRGMNLLDTYKHLWNLAIQLQIIFEQVYSFSPAMQGSEEIKDLEIISLPRACEGFIEKLHKITLQKLTTIVAIRKIQRNWKDKARKSLSIAATVFKGIALLKRGLKHHKNQSSTHSQNST